MRTLLLALLLLAPVAARADVPPPDVCGKPGDACTTAPPDYKSPGVCVKQKCSRAVASGTTIEYDCNRCAPKAPPKGKK